MHMHMLHIKKASLTERASSAHVAPIYSSYYIKLTINSFGKPRIIVSNDIFFLGGPNLQLPGLNQLAGVDTYICLLAGAPPGKG